MKNSEFTIYIMFKDRCINKFRKEKEAVEKSLWPIQN